MTTKPKLYSKGDRYNIVDYDEDKKPIIINPINDQYSKPLDNYSVLYPNIFNDKFVKQHDKIIHKDERF